MKEDGSLSDEQVRLNRIEFEIDHPIITAKKKEEVLDPSTGKPIVYKMAPENDPLAESAREVQVGFYKTRR